MALLSIVIPVYNVEPYLATCLDSVCGQTFKDLEIIAVLSPSTDGTERILKEYAAKDSRINIYAGDGTGVGQARNVGICHATGTYLTYVDADDAIHPQAYETLLTEMKAADVDVIRFTNVYAATGEQFAEALKRDQRSAKKAVLYTSPMQDFLFRRIDIQVWNKIFRRELVKDVRFENIFFEDQLYVLATMAKVGTLLKTQHSFYVYNGNNQGSITRTLNERHITSRFAQFDYMKEFRKSLKLNPIFSLKYKMFMHKMVFLGLNDLFMRANDGNREHLFDLYRRMFKERLGLASLVNFSGGRMLVMFVALYLNNYRLAKRIHDFLQNFRL